METQLGQYQHEVGEWLNKCFGYKIAQDVLERSFRFLEESLELAQSVGCSIEDAAKLVNYVYARPVGEPEQEVGGVMVTLAALCHARKLSLSECADDELARVNTKIEAIRAKHMSKPVGVRSALPGGADTGELTKPPIGLRPRWHVYEERQKEIIAAIQRYEEHMLPVPPQWVDELKFIKSYLSNREYKIARPETLKEVGDLLGEAWNAFLMINDRDKEMTSAHTKEAAYQNIDQEDFMRIINEGIRLLACKQLRKEDPEFFV